MELQNQEPFVSLCLTTKARRILCLDSFIEYIVA